MASQTILLIRHAEKPEPGGDNGVDSTGASDANSLTPRGWQRAGTWVHVFAPPSGQNALLPRPDAVFASAPEKHHKSAAGAEGSKSRRPLETITPLAAKLKLEVDLRFAKGDEESLAAALSETDGVVLVCWQHEKIAAIARGLAPVPQNVPVHWPEDRFNVVFRFDRLERGAPWEFRQIVPVMLDGDESGGL
jgi:hypothetical protein